MSALNWLLLQKRIHFVEFNIIHLRDKEEPVESVEILVVRGFDRGICKRAVESPKPDVAAVNGLHGSGYQWHPSKPGNKPIDAVGSFFSMTS